jgi:hypothetical protein
MPAYSFKERFVPMVKDGSKPGTIRAFRKHEVKMGQLAHLYYGMRTKFCVKLVEPSPVIKRVWIIYINEAGDVALIDADFKEFTSIRWLNDYEKDALAWMDGFRKENDMASCGGCFGIMCRWWRQTHALPFAGTYILWGEVNF